MAKLDAKQQLAVREILDGLRAAVGRIYPGLANLPTNKAAELLEDSTSGNEEVAQALIRAIKAARELDAAH